MNGDNSLTASVRAALAGAGGVREVKMFGGTGFMLNGNLAAAVSKRGLLVRVGKERQQDALARPGARPMEMRGRIMEGYILIDPAALAGDSVRTWLLLACSFVQTLPPKMPGARPVKTKGEKK